MDEYITCSLVPFYWASSIVAVMSLTCKTAPMLLSLVWVTALPNTQHLQSAIMIKVLSLPSFFLTSDYQYLCFIIRIGKCCKWPFNYSVTIFWVSQSMIFLLSNSWENKFIFGSRVCNFTIPILFSIKRFTVLINNLFNFQVSNTDWKEERLTMAEWNCPLMVFGVLCALMTGLTSMLTLSVDHWTIPQVSHPRYFNQ